MKPPGTYRIFCIGQSTTEGYPFEPRGGYPQWLGLVLKDVLPGRKIEVINAGVSGSDSTRDLAIVNDVLNYQPDILVLYEGNNESRQGRIRLLQERFGNRFGLFVFWLRNYFPIVRWAGERLHKRPLQDKELMPIFKRNIKKMIALAEARNVRVALLGQVKWDTLAIPDAPKPFNLFLKSRQNHDVLYIDTLRFFKNDGKCSPIGPKCLLDSEHPSLRGQWLIAATLARGLAGRGWIAPPSAWRWRNIRPMAAYQKKLELTDRFLARAFITEAWSPQTDPHGLALVPDDIAESDRFEKDGIPEIIRTSYKWLGPPSSFVKNAIISYYDKTDPAEAKIFENVLRLGREGKLSQP